MRIFLSSLVKVEQVMPVCRINTDSQRTLFIKASHPTPDRVTQRLGGYNALEGGGEENVIK